jgi:hypothetical protein
MNLNTAPPKRRDGIHVPDDFAAELAERATRAAVASSLRRLRLRKILWTAAATAAVFAGVLLTIRTETTPSVAPATELTSDEAWTALEQGDITLTDDELLELAELHGITTL